ncbi:diacylglycerol kinase family protein [Gorillibacterium timonense]|uniref:diacylglycerol kinase family protein n=1 Tax=Gorillibacterium timonense TaxID=1689269 RepID=UPI00071D278E|nr:diacylglycerol kinase family protein [Gorillibacterium timonense]
MKSGPRFLRSLHYAYEGVKYALSSQPNMKIHFFATFVVIISAVFFRIDPIHLLFLLLAITLVIVTELINTAIEKTVDLAMPNRHPLAKIAKDTAAAAVLVAAVFAIAVGIAVFFQPVERLFHAARDPGRELSVESVWIYLLLVLLVVIVAETRFGRTLFLRPSLLSGVIASLATLIAISSTQMLPAFLAAFMAALFLLILYRRKTRTLPGILFGASSGVAITLLLFELNRLSLPF